MRNKKSSGEPWGTISQTQSFDFVAQRAPGKLPALESLLKGYIGYIWGAHLSLAKLCHDDLENTKGNNRTTPHPAPNPTRTRTRTLAISQREMRSLSSRPTDCGTWWTRHSAARCSATGPSHGTRRAPCARWHRSAGAWITSPCSSSTSLDLRGGTCADASQHSRAVP